MKPILLALSLALFAAPLATSCAAPSAEQRGRLTPADRAVAPPNQELRTDGPTQPRTSPQRPPERRERGQ